MSESMIKKWLKNPLQIGTVLPSSQGLVRLMLEQIPKDPQVIVEFGAGTGPLTAGLNREFPNKKLFSFELDKELAASVKKRFPLIHVFNENVISAPEILPAEIVGQVDAIVSSLPLLSISSDINEKILESAFKLLKPGAPFIQFTYLPFLPPIKAYKEMDIWSQFAGVEFKNLPPAYVWIFRLGLR
jgi:phosphatidylethanolamine/phosphatidyl-N-methylethanolamine N-methyltransferase